MLQCIEEDEKDYFMQTMVKTEGDVTLEGLEFANFLIDALLEKQAEDIVLLDVREQSVFADYFLIGNSDNERQLKAMVRGVDEESKKDANRLRNGIEGKPEGGWVLVDFGEVVVHLFSAEQRAYYRLEELWQEAQLVVRMH
jgi:ribosome-associated protein